VWMWSIPEGKRWLCGKGRMESKRCVSAASLLFCWEPSPGLAKT